MRARRYFPVIYFLSFFISFSVVLGDGKLFIWRNKDADIFQPTQKAFIKWDGSEEKLLLQTKYEGPAEEMVWIVPIPSKPKVKKGDLKVFEKLSRQTQEPDLSYTYFNSLFSHSGGSGSRSPRFVKWRRQIGDYDVALLSPVGSEHVIEWLNTNEFGVPEEAVPILKDYIKDQWWMVAARIHPDALTDITREKLAEGTLHPLEMTFKVTRCIYPLRLTSLTAGPVEELIYIEGPAHYEPVTLRGDWEIDVFGGPELKVPNGYRLTAVEHAMRIVAGKTESNARRYLTKLRRVFKPEEMIEDIIFDKIDYGNLFSSGDPIRIGEAATQYGRHRDPRGIPYLLKSLSPRILGEIRPTTEELQKLLSASTNRPGTQEWLMRQKEMCGQVRSCIWALGEIAIAHGTDSAAETALLRCAKHEKHIIRMEAYVALMKLQSSGISKILLERLKHTFSGDLSHLVSSNGDWFQDNITETEMEIIIEWLERFGTAQVKDVFVNVLINVIPLLPVNQSEYLVREYHIAPTGMVWWPVWQAALTQDPRLLRSLENYRARYPDTDRLHTDFLLKAEASCGSREAISILASRIAEDQNKVLQDREAREKGGYASLQSLNWNKKWDSIRMRILRNRKYGKESYRRIPTGIDDAIIRTALSEYELDDWYALYLLSYIEEPKAADTERIRIIWNKQESDKQLVVVAVLWTWKDTKSLQELYETRANVAVAIEIRRALDSLKNQRD